MFVKEKLKRKSNSDKIILDLCGGTGSWSDPYQKAGYDVLVLDLRTNFDVRLFEFYKDLKVYGILAAPECTHFCRSGARWWKSKGKQSLVEGLQLVDACLRIILLYKLNGNLKFWALENPVGRLNKYLGKPKFMFDPCDFGDPWTKQTCLWGEFNKPIKNPIEPTYGSKMHWRYGGKSRKIKWERSITPSGFAYSFFKANQ